MELERLNVDKPKKDHVWAYATTQYNSVQSVIYDFQPELRLKQR